MGSYIMTYCANLSTCISGSMYFGKNSWIGKTNCWSLPESFFSRAISSTKFRGQQLDRVLDCHLWAVVGLLSIKFTNIIYPAKCCSASAIVMSGWLNLLYSCFMRWLNSPKLTKLPNLPFDWGCAKTGEESLLKSKVVFLPYSCWRANSINI